MGQTYLIRDQALGTGARKVYHLGLRAPGFAGTVQAEDSDGQRNGASIGGDTKWFINISPIETWAAEKEMKDFSSAMVAKAAAASPPGHALGMYVSPPSGKDNIVSQITPDSLPDNWLCYLPFFRAVLIDGAVYKALAPEAREALMRYVEYGGAVTVYNADENRIERRLMGSIQYQIPRFFPRASGPFPIMWDGRAPHWIHGAFLGSAGRLSLHGAHCRQQYRRADSGHLVLHHCRTVQLLLF